jgi:hypothetical protein
MSNGTQDTLSLFAPSSSKAFNGAALLKLITLATAAVLALAAVSPAAELPAAPSAVASATPAAFVPVSSSVAAPATRSAESGPVMNKTFVSLALISTSSTFADSYTTLFARQNWLARKQGVCNAEVQSAYLYGTHPTVARAYGVASAKSAGAVLAAYYLRKHHNRFWSAALIGNTAISLEGVTQNMIECN